MNPLRTYTAAPSTELSKYFTTNCDHSVSGEELGDIEISSNRWNQIKKFLGLEIEQDMTFRQLLPIKPSDIQKIVESVGSGWIWYQLSALLQTHAQYCSKTTTFQDNELLEYLISRLHLKDISALNFSVRVWNILKREGIHTIGDLCSFSANDLGDFRNFGPECLGEVVEQLRLHKLELASIDRLISISDADDKNFAQCKFSALTLRCLSQGGIHSVSDLLAVTDQELLAIRNLRVFSLNEIRQAQSILRNGYSENVTKENDAYNSDEPALSKRTIFDLINKEWAVLAKFESEIGDLECPFEVLRRIKLDEGGHKDESPIEKDVSVSLVLDQISYAIGNLDQEVDALAILQSLSNLMEVFEEYVALRATYDIIFLNHTDLISYESRFGFANDDLFVLDQLTYSLIENPNALEERMMLSGVRDFFELNAFMQKTLTVDAELWFFMSEIANFVEKYGCVPNSYGVTVAIFKFIKSKNIEELWNLFRKNLTMLGISAKQVTRSEKILFMRANGIVLDKIGKDFGITRERVRQILLKINPNLGEIVSEFYSDEKSILRPLTTEKIRKFIESHGAVYASELATDLGIPVDSVRHVVPRDLRKYVFSITERKVRARIWSNEVVIEILRLAATYHFPLVIGEYESLIAAGEIRGPSVPMISNLFGSWSNACKSAGVEYKETKRQDYLSMWSDNDLFNFACRYYLDPLTSGSFHGYDDWRAFQEDQVPSSGSIRSRLGDWVLVKERILRKLREDISRHPM